MLSWITLIKILIIIMKINGNIITDDSAKGSENETLMFWDISRIITCLADIHKGN